jgi:hypothetical protein
MLGNSRNKKSLGGGQGETLSGILFRKRYGWRVISQVGGNRKDRAQTEEFTKFVSRSHLGISDINSAARLPVKHCTASFHFQAPRNAHLL